MKLDYFKLENNKKTFAVLGDNHIGRTLQKYDMSPHIFDVLYQFTDTCVGIGVDFSVLLGDVFDRPTPKLEHQLQFIAWLQHHTQQVPYTYILIGNHEVHPHRFEYGHSALGIIEAMQIHNVKIVSRPLYEDGYLFLPFPSPAFYANQDEYDLDVQEQLTSEHALLQATDFCDEKEVICAFTHLNIVGARVNDTAWEYRGGDYCYNLPYKAIAGHIHKFQHLDNILILGAAGRLRFSEVENTPYILVAAGDGVYLKDVDFPDMFIVTGADQELTTQVCEYLDKVLAHLDGVYDKQIIKINRKSTDVDWNAVRDHLLDKGVLHVMMSAIEVTDRKETVVEVIAQKSENEYMEEFIRGMAPKEQVDYIMDEWGCITISGVAE